MAILLGNVPAIDLYSGSTPIDRVYLGQSKIYDAFAEISGNLPLTFNARRAENLNDYNIYGTTEGAGVKTKNLFDGEIDIDNKIVANKDGYISSNDKYALGHKIDVDSFTAITMSFNCDMSQSPTRTSYPGYFVDENNDNLGTNLNSSIAPKQGMNIIVVPVPNNAKYYIPNWRKISDTEIMLVPGSTAPASYIPYGYKFPLTVESGEQSQDISIYIGDSKLGAEEYVDFGEQKIYKDVSGTLTPTDPPAPLPPIPSYAGANRLYSTITLGEVTVQGRIKNNYPNWFNLTSAQIQQAIALLDSIGTNYDNYPYSGYFACSNKRGSWSDGTPYGLNIVKVKNLDTRVPVNIGIRKEANGGPSGGYQPYMITANIRTEASCVYYNSNTQQFTITKRKDNILRGDLFGSGTDTSVAIFNSEDWFIYLGGDCTISDVT